MSEALAIRNDAVREFNFSKAAQDLKDAALESSACIGRVTTAGEQADAVLAQQNIATLIRDVEKARKAAKEPVLDFGRRIDEKAKEFTKPLLEEQWRVSQLVGNFQKLEEQRVAAARAAENERLLRIEREREAAIAVAKTTEEVDKIQEKACARIQAEAPPIEQITAAKAAGQRVQKDWKIEVTDIHKLYRFHPNCVKLEPLLGEIKALAKAGVQVQGARCWEELSSGVRSGRASTFDV